MLILEYNLNGDTKIETFDSQSNLFLYIKSQGIRKEDILDVSVVKKSRDFKGVYSYYNVSKMWRGFRF